jgi:hypothetical protein
MTFGLSIVFYSASLFTIQQCDQFLTEAVDPYGTAQGTYKATLVNSCYQFRIVQR